ncbi:MAG: PLP-dependent aminotransferase family protein [Acidobacteriota bacterium]|nr:PLP-dependent aminotransferase family protein [Acidobacteriota bacterium]
MPAASPAVKTPPGPAGTAPPPGAPLDSLLAPWLRGRRRSLLRRLVNAGTRPGVLSLAGGLPAVELFPAEAYGRILKDLLESPGSVQYGGRCGELRERVVELARRRGVSCATDRVLVTTGAQQALDVLVRSFVAPRDAVALERFTYTGFREALAPLSPRLVTLPSSLGGGLDVEALERRLRLGARPKLLYVIPDGHNPLGVSLPLESRRRLVALAHEYDFVIVEDDPYGLLCCDGEFDPPLAALDAERVLYVGSLSKILAPALRLGWARVPARLAEALAAVKEMGDLECSRLTMLAAARLLGELDFDRRLRDLRSVYRERRDAMLEALAERLPGGCSFSRPGGGMFVWVELPPGVDGEGLLERALGEFGVVFVPAAAFADARDRAAPANGARLSFSGAGPAALREAVARFAAALDG